MSLEWFLSSRLSSEQSRGSRKSRPAVLVAMAGVAIGLCVMLLANSVAAGFQNELRDKLTGLSQHIRLYSYSSISSGAPEGLRWDDELSRRIHSSLPDVRHIQRFAEQSGVLKTDAGFQGIVLRGVGQEYDTSFISRHLKEGEVPEWTDSVTSNRALVSESLCRLLSLSLGDKIDLYFMDEQVRIRRLEIAGIYATHLSSYDDHYILTDLRTVQRLLGLRDGRVQGLEITLEGFDSLDEDALTLALDLDGYKPEKQHLLVQSLRDANPSMFAWLDILDMNIYIILVLMILVAGFTMASGILIILLERTAMIGTLKSLGATDSQLRRTFLSFSSLLVLKGMAAGNCLALALMLFQASTHFMSLDPENYYMDHVPVLVDPLQILWVNLLCFLSMILFVMLPLRLIASIRPAETMRFQ